MNSFDQYKKEYIDKIFERKDLFSLLSKNYDINNALYPGSFVHITPSFFIPEVVYIDSDKNAKRFFEDSEFLTKFIIKNKSYKNSPSYRFFYQDYSLPIDIPNAYFDLLISQWAGPVSQSCKKYLKPNGFLIVNNSHADAGIAYLDNDYQLISVINLINGKYIFSEKDLDTYFKPKSPKNVTIESLNQSGSGIAYTKKASSYLFKNIKEYVPENSKK